jgi:hypothetical protein
MWLICGGRIAENRSDRHMTPFGRLPVEPVSGAKLKEFDMDDVSKTLEFRYKPVKMTLWIMLFAAVIAGFLFMAYASLDPDFYATREASRYRWFGDIMGGLPVWARVSIWLALALMVMAISSIFLRRMLSGQPPLVVSSEGLTGFSGFGVARKTIHWNDISKTQIAQSNLLIHGAPIDTGGVRKPKAPSITVHLGMIGESGESVLRKIEEFRRRLMGI